MKQVQSSCLGCGGVLIVLGILGFVSTFVNLGSSNRAIVQMFFLLANSFGSVPVFSIITIVLGILLILFIYLLNEYQKSKPDENKKR